MNIEEYITTLTEQIRCKKVIPKVAQEIRNHIADQAQAYEQSGIAHDKAIERAVLEMGDPVEAGAALDRIHRPQFDWRLFAITVFFSVTGVFLMYVTGALGSEQNQLVRQFAFTALGIGIIILICFVDYTFIGKYPVQMYIIMTVAFYIYHKTGRQVNGLRAPALRSLVYLYAPVYAGLLYKYRGKGIFGIIKLFGFLLLTALLSQWFATSLYVNLSIGAICTLLLLYAIMKGWFPTRTLKIGKNQITAPVLAASVFIFALLVFAVYFSVFAADYQKMRLMAFLDPNAYMNENYQVLATRRAINGAQIFGESTQGTIIKQFVQQDTFLILAQVVAMYGLIAGAAIITAFAAFAYRALHVVRHQKNQLGIILSAACFLLVFFNCTTGILMNFGLLPMSSLQFPFLSRGGSGTIMYAVIIGLLMSCRRYEKIIDLSADVR